MRAQRQARIKRSWLAINGASLYLHQECVCAWCVCIQSGVVNHAECALTFLSVLPMCSLRGAVTYGYRHGRDDSVLHPHTYTQAPHRTTSQPPAEAWEKSWRLQDSILMLFSTETHILDYTQQLGLWIFGCLLQCGCLNSAARDRIYKVGVQHFSVCWLSACVKDAEG